MPDYERMYHRLFNAMTNAITLLQEAQNDTEEIYVNSEPVVLDFLKIAPSRENIQGDTAKKSGSHVQ